ncbi:MAG: CBS domain-containing protein [Thermoanaerobaculia bacterium]|nr:MAG: CBS domain-containing protein [Thermoanaerobaculia bacterium]MBZ0100581.1 hypothetical protein [Thermoanaerobaculia bacterium]
MTEVRLSPELDRAMEALETSFHVRLIATFGEELLCAPVEAPAEEWLGVNGAEFDQFPVRRGAETIGVLLRSPERPRGTVGDAMMRLSEALLVSADLPLTKLIPELRNRPFRLVLRGGRIDGLVTRSDLLKIPVRMVLFAIITHLEQIMADVIVRQWPIESEWFNRLATGRQENSRKKLAGLQERRMDPQLIEVTEFSDKRDLCRLLIEAGGKNRFEADMNGLRDLRDSLAHAATFLTNDGEAASIESFVSKFESALVWIRELNALRGRLGVEK